MARKNAYEIQVSVLLKDCFLDSDIREELILHFKDYIDEKFRENVVGINVNKVIELTVKEDSGI